MNLIKTQDPGDEVWGVAYDIDDEVWAAEVGAQLDHREKGGYTRYAERFHPRDGDDVKEVIVYVGDLDDKQYAGPAPTPDIADTIHRSVGPSGLNKDYLYNLADAIREVIRVDDDHVFELETAVKHLDQDHQTPGHQ